MSIKKDDIFELEITSMTHDGMGVGRKDGMAVFVQGAIDGETVRAKVIKLTKSYAVARIVDFLSESADRQEPFCPVYKRCGGCSLQHLSYEKTLQFKRQVVEDNLKRIGKLSNVTIHETIGMKDPSGYRNKAQYPVGMGQGGPVAGFFARRSHEIVDADRCAIQQEISDKAKHSVLHFVRKNDISIYNEESNYGLIRHIVTKVAFHTKEVMVIVVSASPSLPKREKLVEAIRREVPGVKSIVLNVNSKPGNVVLGDKNITLFGKDTIEDKLGDFVFEISPLSFYQVNPVQTEVLYGKAIEYARLTGTETVFDLYCGIGTISLFAAKHAKQIIGVESVPEAIDAARANALRNEISNTEFHVGDVDTVLPDLAGKGIKADVVILDPPRKGCEESVLQTLASIAPQRIVYVSCNPSTLARDLGFLSQHGYEVLEAQPVDMFPWTEHIECCVRIERVKG